MGVRIYVACSGNANDGKGEPTPQGYVEFEDVHFFYSSMAKNSVLKGLDLVIRACWTTVWLHQVVSSIVAFIQHFHEPDGTVTIDGVNVRDISHMYFHHKVAMVAQEPVL